MPDAGGVRGGSLSAAGGGAGAGAGAESPRGAPRGDVCASSVGLVDAPETDEETSETSPRTPGSMKKRRAGKNFIRKYRTSSRDSSSTDYVGGGAPSKIDPRVSESLERLLEAEDDEEDEAEDASFDASSDASNVFQSPSGERRTRRAATRRLDAAASRFAALHPARPPRPRLRRRWRTWSSRTATRSCAWASTGGSRCSVAQKVASRRSERQKRSETRLFSARDVRRLRRPEPPRPRPRPRPGVGLLRFRGSSPRVFRNHRRGDARALRPARRPVRRGDYVVRE